jgi:terminase small subunit-like protein
MTDEPMRQADVARRLSNMAKARRCGAKTRAGHPCRQAAVRGRARCRMHGGAKGSGGPRGNRNGNFKHGLHTREAERDRRAMRAKIREIEAVVRAAEQPRHSSHRRSGRRASTLNSEKQAEHDRPSDYSSNTAMTICERLVAGESLGAICADAGMPAKATVFGWLDRNEEFRRLYALARELLTQDLADEILEIADDSTDDWIEYRGKDGKVRRVFNLDNILRARLRIAVRKRPKPQEHDRGVHQRVRQLRQ